VIKLVLAIDDMQCTNCAMHIDWALEDLDGVKEANTSFARSRTEVTFDPAKVTQEQLLAAIRDAGYQVRVLA
jgi:copper chaperone CopZ